MYIVLDNRPDRMGANLTWYIMQLIYAHKNNWFVHYYESPFDKSIFFKAICRFVDKYNKVLGIKLGTSDHEWRSYVIDRNEQDWPGNNMKVCLNIKQDLVSYYYEHLYTDMMACFNSVVVENIHLFREMPQLNLNKTIAVHLRLDDIVDRVPYDGTHSTEYYRKKLDSGDIAINLNEEQAFFRERGIWVPSYGRGYNPYDCQAPIEEQKVQEYIDKAKQAFPDHDVVIVTSPISKVTLPYPVIKSTDADIDLFIMSKADVLICSKSLFCFSALYFGKAHKRYIPMWGHIAGTGLTSKYDRTENHVYMY